MELGGLDLILSRCHTDVSNPLLREWALLCVRHACRDNTKVQTYIAGLVPHGVVQSEELTERGLTVSFSERTGKVTVKPTA